MIFYTLWYFIVWLKERWFKRAVNCAGLIWIYGFFIKIPSVWWFFLAESLFLFFFFFFLFKWKRFWMKTLTWKTMKSIKIVTVNMSNKSQFSFWTVDLHDDDDVDDDYGDDKLYFTERWTDERRLALFPVRTIISDRHHRHSPTRCEQDHMNKSLLTIDLMTQAA